MITEKQLCKALSQYNGEEVDSLQQVVKITFSGEELLEFVNSLPSEEDYWKQRCLLAEKFIEESPCDPDITHAQMDAYKAYNEFLNTKSGNSDT